MTEETPAGTGQVRVTRELSVSPDVAWTAWSDPSMIRQWWGPQGFTCPRADVDFRVGGTTLVTMQAPAEYGGFQMHNRWTYTLIDAPQRLEFLSTFADATGSQIEPAAAGIPPGVPNEVPHIVELRPLPGGGTTLTVTELGYTSEEARAQSEAGQEQTLDKMQALLSTRS